MSIERDAIDRYPHRRQVDSTADLRRQPRDNRGHPSFLRTYSPYLSENAKRSTRFLAASNARLAGRTCDAVSRSLLATAGPNSSPAACPCVAKVNAHASGQFRLSGVKLMFRSATTKIPDCR